MKLPALLSRYRTALILVVALASGAAAAHVARSQIAEHLARERARLAPAPELVEVVVARRDLSRGDAVDVGTMAVRALPRDFVPGGAIVPGQFDALAGRRLSQAMRSGEPLLVASLERPEAAGFSSRLRPGVRALTIGVDEINSISGMLQPGDRIDLLLSVRPPATDGVARSEVTHPLMQDLLVLATGRQTRAATDTPSAAGAATARNFGTITVEVDFERAQQLVVAQRSGKLTAVLRNPEDRKAVEPRRLDIDGLLDLPARRVAARASGPEIIVGGRGAIAAPAPAQP